jgi:hypothetical protein
MVQIAAGCIRLGRAAWVTIGVRQPHQHAVALLQGIGHGRGQRAKYLGRRLRAAKLIDQFVKCSLHAVLTMHGLRGLRQRGT